MTVENVDDAVIVALGSNLGGEYGSSRAAISRALEQFPDIGLGVKAKSSLWRSRAWPDASQPEYLNAVVLVETELEALGVLKALHRLEARFGRARNAVNEARMLDLDLIAFGRLTLETADLILPHPRAAERRFVMGPLAEIAPSWRHPISGETAAALATAAAIGQDAEPIT